MPASKDGSMSQKCKMCLLLDRRTSLIPSLALARLPRAGGGGECGEENGGMLSHDGNLHHNVAEYDLHATIVTFLRYAFEPPDRPPDVIFHHSPNEGRRGRYAQAALYDHGTQAGWPDLEFIHGGRIYLMEIKKPKGTLSKEQENLLPALQRAGAAIAVARSLSEAYNALMGWELPLMHSLDEFLHLTTSPILSADELRTLERIGWTRMLRRRAMPRPPNRPKTARPKLTVRLPDGRTLHVPDTKAGRARIAAALATADSRSRR